MSQLIRFGAKIRKLKCKEGHEGQQDLLIEFKPGKSKVLMCENLGSQKPRTWRTHLGMKPKRVQKS